MASLRRGVAIQTAHFGYWRVLEKAGFSREGVLRDSVFKDGQLIDSVLYAKLRVV